MREAFELAEAESDRPGYLLAGLEWLDEHPEARIVLEGTFTGRGGLVMEMIEDTTTGSIPGHLNKYRRAFMRRCSDQKAINDIFMILKDLYGDPGYTSEAGIKSVLKWIDVAAEREYKANPEISLPDCGALAMFKATLYLRNLVNQLPDVQEGRGSAEDETEFDEVQESCDEDSWDELLEPQAAKCGPMIQARVLYSPSAVEETDWLFRQSLKFKHVYFGIQGVKSLNDLDPYRERLLAFGKSRSFSSSQMTVLWDAYRIRRDASLKKAGCQGFAGKLVKRIQRETSAKILGKMGCHLFAWSKDQKVNGYALPSPVSPTQWAYIWSVYKAKKEELGCKA